METELSQVGEGKSVKCTICKNGKDEQLCATFKSTECCISFTYQFYMNYGLLLYLKLARVDVGNVSKKGENMEGIIT